MDEIINEQSGDQTSGEERSHHRHRRHSKKHRHFKRKLEKFWKKHQKVIKNVALLVLALALVASLAVLADLYSKGRVEEAPPAADTGSDEAPVMRIEVPYFEGDVPLIGDKALKFLSRDLSEPAMDAMERIDETKQRQDVGLSVVLSLDVSGMPSGCAVGSAVVEVSENQDLSDPMLYPMESGESSVALRLLKTNTRYYYRINYTLTDGTVSSVGSTFKTADSPRILSVDGIVNVRDIGAWKTTDGKTIRQGLLYRGSELDGAIEPTYCLTESGRHDMLAVLGIRTDIDLRAHTDNVYGNDALGANVRHIYYGNYGAPAYVGIFEESGKNLVGQIFSDLSDENNYPVYLHCTYGLDRTGTMCYLLEALLGVSEDDLRRDYELSVLYSGYLSAEEFEAFVTELKKLEGDTLQQKVENYLLSAGVTTQQIASIKQIFLEG